MIYFSRRLGLVVKHGPSIWVALILTLILQSCQTVETANTFKDQMKGLGWICEAFRPITYAHEDDGDTVVQILEHNAAWHALCA
jgi:hypothetical protein